MKRLQFDIDDEIFDKLQFYLSHGERSLLFRHVAKDLCELMSSVGPGLVLAGIITDQLKAEDYTNICHNLHSIFKKYEETDGLAQDKTLNNDASSSRSNASNTDESRTPNDSSSSKGKEIEDFLKGEELFKELSKFSKLAAQSDRE
jgi:hypothetical protein